MPGCRARVSTRPSPVRAVLTSTRSSAWSTHWDSSCMRELRETRCARARPIPTDSVRACCYAVAGHGFTTGKGATHHIIHRGRHEIGGMCIEVAADDGTGILLDLGMPLQAPDGGDFPWGTPQRPTEELIAEGVLVDVPGVFPHDPAAPDVAAIVLTHSHLDHYGLAHHAHPAIPVFGSPGTLAILDVGRVFFPDAELPTDLRALPTDEPVHLRGLTVTAIPVDHAAPDSRALLCEADGQRLLYTGDLRAHGRTGFRFENLLADERVTGVDWLLCEGTTLGSSGGSHGLSSEADVEERLLELALENPAKLLAVAASGQNLDRLASWSSTPTRPTCCSSSRRSLLASRR